nr:NERD domain-containing protein [Psychrobacter urativorans]
MSSFKGILGETAINIATWLKLDKAAYHRLNNIALPLSNGGSTQIDHVIVSVYGIFIIETKNYKGWIFGKEKQAQWTQTIMGRKYKFQNPLRQNYLHIKTLAELLELDMSYFHSMIAFIGECELKTRDELPEHVLKGGAVSYIKKKQDKILTEAEVQSIVGQIETNRFAKSWRTNRQHKTYLKDKHTDAGNKQSTVSSIKSNTESNTSHNSIQSAKPKIQSNSVVKVYSQWSGQVEQADSSIMAFTSKNAVFITPFGIVGFEPEINKPEVNKASSNEPVITKQVNEALISSAIPTCPKCNGEMIQRVAKKGARQGQAFFGCSQFPKCRGVVNIS